MGDLVKRLRDAANGLGTLKSELGDFGLCDEAADRIEALEAENARLRGLFQSDGKTTFRTDKMTRGQAHDAVRAAQEETT